MSDIVRQVSQWYFALSRKVILKLLVSVILYSPPKLSEGQYHDAKHHITAKQYHSPQGEYN